MVDFLTRDSRQILAQAEDAMLLSNFDVPATLSYFRSLSSTLEGVASKTPQQQTNLRVWLRKSPANHFAEDLFPSSNPIDLSVATDEELNGYLALAGTIAAYDAQNPPFLSQQEQEGLRTWLRLPNLLAHRLKTQCFSRSDRRESERISCPRGNSIIYTLPSSLPAHSSNPPQYQPPGLFPPYVVCDSALWYR